MKFTKLKPKSIQKKSEQLKIDLRKNNQKEGVSYHDFVNVSRENLEHKFNTMFAEVEDEMIKAVQKKTDEKNQKKMKHENYKNTLAKKAFEKINTEKATFDLKREEGQPKKIKDTFFGKFLNRCQEIAKTKEPISARGEQCFQLETWIKRLNSQQNRNKLTGKKMKEIIEGLIVENQEQKILNQQTNWIKNFE